MTVVVVVAVVTHLHTYCEVTRQAWLQLTTCGPKREYSYIDFRWDLRVEISALRMKALREARRGARGVVARLLCLLLKLFAAAGCAEAEVDQLDVPEAEEALDAPEA